VFFRQLALLSPPKADPTDAGIEFARQVFAKSNQADVAPHDIPELNFPAISFADEVAEGPVMVLYLWSQFYCEVMIAVGPRRASGSTTEQPERRDGIGAFSPIAQLPR
jgi:hypothetical protein